MSQPG